MGTKIINKLVNDSNVVIGDECDVGCEVMFCTSTHEIGTGARRAGKGIGCPIIVGKGCWIGEGCVIAAGAVVNKDCEPHGLNARVPARRIKELNDNGMRKLNNEVYA